MSAITEYFNFEDGDFLWAVDTLEIVDTITTR
jgi:hypothetical protein